MWLILQGMLRALYGNLHPTIPIRINALAPSWTATGIVPKAVFEALGEGVVQSADVVARSVLVLMADKNRHGEMIYSDRGKFWDIENGEAGLNAYGRRMIGSEYDAEEGAITKIRNMIAGLTKKGERVETEKETK